MINVFYKNSDGVRHPVNSIEEWKAAFFFLDSKPSLHWKVGRSAESLAKFICEKNGHYTLKTYVEELINESITFNDAEIEHSSCFDNFKGTPRKQDLSITAKTTKSRKDVFIGIEAKVDESFGNSISTEYNKAQKLIREGKRTNRPERIDNLTRRFCNGATLSSDGAIGKIQYQLLHYLAGSVSEKASIIVMPVIIFETDLYDCAAAEKNEETYSRFFYDYMGFNGIVGKLNKHAYYKKVEGKDVYTTYIHIKF